MKILLIPALLQLLLMTGCQQNANPAITAIHILQDACDATPIIVAVAKSTGKISMTDANAILKLAADASADASLALTEFQSMDSALVMDTKVAGYFSNIIADAPGLSPNARLIGQAIISVVIEIVGDVHGQAIASPATVVKLSASDRKTLQSMAARSTASRKAALAKIR